MTWKFKIRFLAFFSIILLCVGVTFKEIQNDTFYIIKLGEYISENGVDLVDHYCWIADLSYTYPHWLYDFIMYIVYSQFDFLGIYISTIILFIILILSIYVINLKTNKSDFMAFFIAIISIACLYAFATARAQLVTAILFLWQVYFIEKLIENGSKKYIIYLILISWLVANLHATIWLFYFILYLPFFGQQIIYIFSNARFTKKKFKFLLSDNSKIVVEKLGNIKELIIAFFGSFLIGVFTPSRICYSYIFKVMLGNSQNYITEHAPMYVIQHPCFMIFIVVLLLVLIFSQTKIKVKELFMFCGLVLMSLVSVRHVAFFYIIGIFYLSTISNRYLNEKGDMTFNVLEKIIVNDKFIYLGLMVLVVVFSYFKFEKNFKKDYVPVDEYPVKAVGFIKNNLNLDNLKLYNNYNVGSYLLFNDIPVFIDSRCDLYLSEFNGLDYSIFDDAMEMAYFYEKKFEFYDVSHALVSKNDILFIILEKDQNYELIYEDDNFALFGKV